MYEILYTISPCHYYYDNVVEKVAKVFFTIGFFGSVGGVDP